MLVYNKVLQYNKLLQHLIERGLIDTEDVVNGDITLVDASRRNHNLKIYCKRTPSYLLKQGDGSVDIGSVAYEKKVYAYLHRKKITDDFDLPLPKYYSYNEFSDEQDDIEQDDILILELLRDAQNLREYHVRQRDFPAELAGLVGKRLGALHHPAFLEDSLPQNGHQPTHDLPPILSIHHPSLKILYNISHGNIELIRGIQRFGELCNRIDHLHGEWQRSAIIHGDLRWDNYVISGAQNGDEILQVHLVDWEFARVGDPRWDVGTVLSEYLLFWLLSLPVLQEIPPERLEELSEYPLAMMQPAMRSFWQSYAQQMALDSMQAEAWLIRSTEYAAVRLIECATEQLHNSTQLTGHAVFLLQLSMNMLLRPREAATQLFGVAM